MVGARSLSGSDGIAELGQDGVAGLVVFSIEEIVVALDANLEACDVLVCDRERAGHVLVPVVPSRRQDFSHETSVWVEVEVGAHAARYRDTSHHVDDIDAWFERDWTELDGSGERQPRPDAYLCSDTTRMEGFVRERLVPSCHELDAVPAFFSGGHRPTVFDSHKATTCFLFKLRFRSGVNVERLPSPLDRIKSILSYY